MWAGMTPQAPCTKNCITNAPSTSRGTPGANAQMGMVSTAPARASAMVRRRPRRSEYRPQITPPASAPTWEKAVSAARGGAQAPDSLHRRGVHVLGAVRNHVDHRHQDGQVEKQLPIRDDRLAQTAPILVAGLAPHLGFLDARPHEQRQQGGEAADEEERSPTPVREYQEVAHRCQQVSEGISLLE